MSTGSAFTVVLPCFQAAAFLPETLACLPQGILAIAVDDASTDGTAALLEDWRSEDPPHRTVLHHSANQGLGATEHGLARGPNRLILFLDADDVLETGWHSALAHALAQVSAERTWLWHPYTEWDGQRKRLRPDRPTPSGHRLGDQTPSLVSFGQLDSSLRPGRSGRLERIPRSR